MELLRPLNEAEYPAQTIALSSGTPTASTANAWNPGPQGVLVWSTVPCYVTVGADPITAATTNSTPIPANVPIPFYVHQQSSGRPWRVSTQLIGTTSGTVYCKPMNIR